MTNELYKNCKSVVSPHVEITSSIIPKIKVPKVDVPMLKMDPWGVSLYGKQCTKQHCKIGFKNMEPLQFETFAIQAPSKKCATAGVYDKICNLPRRLFPYIIDDKSHDKEHRNESVIRNFDNWSQDLKKQKDARASRNENLSRATRKDVLTVEPELTISQTKVISSSFCKGFIDRLKYRSQSLCSNLNFKTSLYAEKSNYHSIRGPAYMNPVGTNVADDRLLLRLNNLNAEDRTNDPMDKEYDLTAKKPSDDVKPPGDVGSRFWQTINTIASYLDENGVARVQSKQRCASSAKSAKRDINRSDSEFKECITFSEIETNSANENTNTKNSKQKWQRNNKNDSMSGMRHKTVNSPRDYKVSDGTVTLSGVIHQATPTNDVSNSNDERFIAAVRRMREENEARHRAKNVRCPLLGDQSPQNKGKATLVLDLDETLVHSSIKRTANNSNAFALKLHIDGSVHEIFVSKRPGVDQFLQTAAHLFEIVIFTASLNTYANAVMNVLDPLKLCSWRLSREACTEVIVHRKANYVKDLRKLGRDISQVIIVDNSPLAYSFQPENAIPISSWFDDPFDNELLELLPVLQELVNVDNVQHAIRKTFSCKSSNTKKMLSSSVSTSYPIQRINQSIQLQGD